MAEAPQERCCSHSIPSCRVNSSWSHYEWCLLWLLLKVVLLSFFTGNLHSFIPLSCCKKDALKLRKSSILCQTFAFLSWLSVWIYRVKIHGFHYFFWCLKCTRPGWWSPPDMFPSFSESILALPHKMLQAQLVLSPRSPDYSECRTLFGSQDLKSQCAHCCGGVMVPLLFVWTGPGSTQMHTHTHRLTFVFSSIATCVYIESNVFTLTVPTPD